MVHLCWCLYRQKFGSVKRHDAIDITHESIYGESTVELNVSRSSLAWYLWELQLLHMAKLHQLKDDFLVASFIMGIQKLPWNATGLSILIVPKWWYPQIIHLNRDFHYKSSILGYPYVWGNTQRIPLVAGLIYLWWGIGCPAWVSHGFSPTVVRSQVTMSTCPLALMVAVDHRFPATKRGGETRVSGCWLKQKDIWYIGEYQVKVYFLLVEIVIFVAQNDVTKRDFWGCFWWVCF